MFKKNAQELPLCANSDQTLSKEFPKGCDMNPVTSQGLESCHICVGSALA